MRGGRSLVTRRRLLQLIGGGVVAAVGYEAGRVLIGTNVHTVIPGRVYRSAQLSQGQLEQLIAERGIRTVVNLRGCCPEMEWYMGDARATCRLGINQEDLTFSAKRYPHPGEVYRLVQVLEQAEYPLLLHCARGADRTGLASTLAVLLLTGCDLTQARWQLSVRYGHLAVGRTAAMDRFFDYYEAWLQQEGKRHSPERLRQWIEQHYCPGPFRAELRLLETQPLQWPAGQGRVLRLLAVNRAIEPWQFVPGGSGGVQLRYSLLVHGSGRLVFRERAGRFRRQVLPGQAVELRLGFPPLPSGRYLLHADLVDMQPIDLLDSDFAQYGSEPLQTTVRIT
ncbi:MAG: tyrosine-protein phosphatase [Thermogemmata sp.]|nr:tyrosine-protein phosphatase [Thermogemmata sp.]